MTRRSLFWILAGLAAVVLVGLAVWRASPPSSPAPGTAASIGGPFQLVDQHGKTVNQNLLKGKWSAVFFGYTYCPDYCPNTLMVLGGATDALGPRAKAFQVVFVTVDPQRDTPKQMDDYLSSAAYSKGVIGLTGSEAQIDAITKAYGVYAQKEGSAAQYAVDHSLAIYLMNPKGRLDSVIPTGLNADQVRDRVVKAMRENAAAN